MPHATPLPVMVLTALSSTLSIIIVILTFLNLHLVWIDLIPGFLTLVYHLIINLTAFYKLYHEHLGVSDSPFRDTVANRRNLKLISHPLTTVSFGIILFALWVIAFGSSMTVAIEHLRKTLTPTIDGVPSKTQVQSMTISSMVNRPGLVGGSLAIAVEILVIVAFVLYCARTHKKLDEMEQEELDEKKFYLQATPTSLTPMSSIRKSIRRISKRYSRAKELRLDFTNSTAASSLAHLPPLPLTPALSTKSKRKETESWVMVTPGLVPSGSDTPVEPSPTVSSSPSSSSSSHSSSSASLSSQAPLRTPPPAVVHRPGSPTRKPPPAFIPPF